jgi:hypothetical protein
MFDAWNNYWDELTFIRRPDHKFDVICRIMTPHGSRALPKFKIEGVCYHEINGIIHTRHFTRKFLGGKPLRIIRLRIVKRKRRWRR